MKCCFYVSHFTTTFLAQDFSSQSVKEKQSLPLSLLTHAQLSSLFPSLSKCLPTSCLRILVPRIIAFFKKAKNLRLLKLSPVVMSTRWDNINIFARNWNAMIVLLIFKKYTCAKLRWKPYLNVYKIIRLFVVFLVTINIHAIYIFDNNMRRKKSEHHSIWMS